MPVTVLAGRGEAVEVARGLRPAFAAEGTVTAASSSGINDGAAALVVMGLGPVGAVQGAIARAGIALSDIGVIELNEAFAAQSLAVPGRLGLDPARVNVHGGAIALGHPIGASGARVLTTLLHAMARGDHRVGLAALCIGGDQGIAMVVERAREA